MLTKPLVASVCSISARLRNRSVESDRSSRPSEAKVYVYRKETYGSATLVTGLPLVTWRHRLKGSVTGDGGDTTKV